MNNENGNIQSKEEEGIILVIEQHIRELKRLIDNYRDEIAGLKSETQMLKKDIKDKDLLLTQLLHELGPWKFEMSNPIVNTVFAKRIQKCLDILWDAGYIDISMYGPTI